MRKQTLVFREFLSVLIIKVQFLPPGKPRSYSPDLIPLGGPLVSLKQRIAMEMRHMHWNIRWVITAAARWSSLKLC